MGEKRKKKKTIIRKSRAPLRDDGTTLQQSGSHKSAARRGTCRPPDRLALNCRNLCLVSGNAKRQGRRPKGGLRRDKG